MTCGLRVVERRSKFIIGCVCSRAVVCGLAESFCTQHNRRFFVFRFLLNSTNGVCVTAFLWVGMYFVPACIAFCVLCV